MRLASRKLFAQALPNESREPSRVKSNTLRFAIGLRFRKRGSIRIAQVGKIIVQQNMAEAIDAAIAFQHTHFRKVVLN